LESSELDFALVLEDVVVRGLGMGEIRMVGERLSLWMGVDEAEEKG
jgi:hypothetical protein